MGNVFAPAPVTPPGLDPRDHRLAAKQPDIEPGGSLSSQHRLDGTPHASRPHTCVRDIQLPQHLIEKLIEALLILCIGNERLVTIMLGAPIQSAKIRVKVGVVHRLPHRLKDAKVLVGLGAVGRCRGWSRGNHRRGGAGL